MGKRTLFMGLFLSVVFILFFISCGDKGIKNPHAPEPPKPQAIISMGSNPSPIIFYWNAWTLQYEGTYSITISETNGVGCNISTIESAFYYNDQAYAPATIQGSRLNANGSITANFSGFTLITYPQIRILVKGADDNGYQINTSKLFNVVYY